MTRGKKADLLFEFSVYELNLNVNHLLLHFSELLQDREKVILSYYCSLYWICYVCVWLVHGAKVWEVSGYLWSWKRCYSRHSGIMHFSTSSTSAPQMEPSAGGVFTMRSLLLMPRPQVALQISHSPHSVTRQLLGAEAKRERKGTVNLQLYLH